MKILVVQTAFLGDVILTLSLIQSLKKRYPASLIDVLVIPGVAPVLRNHPAIRNVIIYDKKGADAGLSGWARCLKGIRSVSYDCAVVPHRSVRSASLVRFAGIPKRIGFDASSGAWMFTDIVPYDSALHEVDRNARLLRPLGIEEGEREFPKLYPSDEDRDVAGKILSKLSVTDPGKIVTLAPGSVWNTKRWPKERFAALAQKLTGSGLAVVVVGGAADRELGEEIVSGCVAGSAISAAGSLPPLQSAAIIGISRLLVTNDTAPMHMAVAMRTQVVAIYGATVPAFGFAPFGRRDVVVETRGLSCRPCSIHGGDECPIKTFECMLNITPEAVYASVLESLS